jgi:hypothetical protein
VPDWDSTERSDSDEDATWRDLVARFDSPVAAQEPAPWPERENTAADSADGPAAPGGTGGAGGAGPGGVPPKTVIISASPSVPMAPRELDEHFVPEPPPPLPKLDPLAKGAWLALFGGPGYLLLATALGWSIPGVAVFCAVAAFVAGVALLVFRLNDSDRDDSDDDGAVV